MSRESCLKVLEGVYNEGIIKEIYFKSKRKELLREFKDLRKNRKAQQLHVVGIDMNYCEGDLFKRLSTILRSHPSIQRVRFHDCGMFMFGTVFDAIAENQIPSVEFSWCEFCSVTAADLQLLLVPGTIQELIFDKCTFRHGHRAERILAACIEKNRSLRSFTYNHCTLLIPILLFDAVTTMVAQNRNLKKLHLSSILDGKFIADLAQILEQNTSLCSVSLHMPPPIDAALRHHLERIRYFAAINRVGGLRLTEYQGHIPHGLWARVLARSSANPDGVFFVLMEKPDIVF
jgi:hypothetical protein